MLTRPAIPRGTVQLSLEQVVETIRGALTTGARAEEAVHAFERRVASFVGTSRGIATSSGKAALVSILRGLGARPGDGVVLCSYNVPEVISVISGMDLRPRFVDIDPATYNLDPAKVEGALDSRTRFLLATHLYGHPADLGRLSAVCERHGIALIEDCCQSLGARFQGKRVGTFGRAALFSFGMMKSLNTLKGGMVVTSDEALAHEVARQVAHAPAEKPAALARDLSVAVALRLATSRVPFAMAGYPILRASQWADNSVAYRLVKMRPASLESGRIDPDSVLGRMEAAQARCGLAGLDDVEAAAERRTQHAERLAAALAPLAPAVECQKPLPDAAPTWSQFVIRVDNRAAVQKRLLTEGIDTTMGYLQACHRLPGTGADPDGFPHSDDLEQRNLYLPISESLDDRDIDWIAQSVTRAVRA